MPTIPQMPSRPASPGAAGRLRIPVIGLVALAIGFIGGYGTGRASVPIAKSYQEGYDAARKKVEALHVFPSAPKESTGLTGKVTSISDSSLEIDADLAGPNPFENMPGPIKRTVRISARTKTYRISLKSEETLRKERQAAATATNTGPLGFSPADPYMKTEIPASEISVGDIVRVGSDRDILQAAAFDATEIDITAR